MNPNIPGQQPKTRKAVLIFLKAVAPPMVFYVDNPEEVYIEVKQIIKSASPTTPKLVEKTGNGPLKKLAVLDVQLAGVAIQEEPVT